MNGYDILRSIRDVSHLSNDQIDQILAIGQINQTVTKKKKTTTLIPGGKKKKPAGKFQCSLYKYCGKLIDVNTFAKLSQRYGFSFQEGIDVTREYGSNRIVAVTKDYVHLGKWGKKALS